MAESATYGWSGEDWQAYCDQLFALRHAPGGYCRVPDRDRGDLGMEGYSTDDTGCAYQCYVAEGAETVEQRVDAQRNKINREMLRLRRRADAVAALLGDVIIHVWILVVPVHDSRRIVEFIRAKEQEMRAAGLQFLDPGFRIQIQTDAVHFAAECATLEAAGGGMVQLPPPAVVPEAVGQLLAERAEQVQRMREKLDRLLGPNRTEQASALTEAMLDAVLDGGDIEAQLRNDHPVVHEQYLREYAAEQRDVTLEGQTGASGESAYVTNVRSRFEERLRREVGALGSLEANRLSHAAIGSWLLQCPMDFADRDQN